MCLFNTLLIEHILNDFFSQQFTLLVLILILLNFMIRDMIYKYFLLAKDYNKF